MSSNAVITRFPTACFQLPSMCLQMPKIIGIFGSFACVLCLLFVLNMGTGVHSSFSEKLMPFSAFSQESCLRFLLIHCQHSKSTIMSIISPDLHQRLNSLYLEFHFSSDLPSSALNYSFMEDCHSGICTLILPCRELLSPPAWTFTNHFFPSSMSSIDSSICESIFL